MIPRLLLCAALLSAQDLAELSRQAGAAMRAQRFAEAERIYRQLCALEPANVLWRMNLGLALHSARRYREAIPEFAAYLRSQPQPGPVHLLLGLSHLKLAQPCQAIMPLEQALLWDRQRATVELADAYYGCKRFERAARTYESAIRITRDSRVARQAAHCYWQARLYPDAKRLFVSIAAAHAREPEFNYEFGDTLARLEGPEAGLPYLRQAVAGNPRLLPARGELGKALLATGDAAGAIPHLEAAAAEDATLLLPLSRAYRAAGRATDAERAQQQYRARVAGR